MDVSVGNMMIGWPLLIGKFLSPNEQGRWNDDDSLQCNSRGDSELFLVLVLVPFDSDSSKKCASFNFIVVSSKRQFYSEEKTSATYLFVQVV